MLPGGAFGLSLDLLLLLLLLLLLRRQWLRHGAGRLRGLGEGLGQAGWLLAEGQGRLHGAGLAPALPLGARLVLLRAILHSGSKSEPCWKEGGSAHAAEFPKQRLQKLGQKEEWASTSWLEVG